MSASPPRLQVRGLTLRFGGLCAVEDVEFDVEAGKIVAIIGPNGAGKTSLFNVITGIYAPSAGSVALDGRDVVAAPDLRARLGWASVGLACAAFAVVVASDVDALWAALFKAGPPWQFTLGGALDAGHAHLAASPPLRLLAAGALGLVVGAMAARALWLRAQRTPQQIARLGVARTFQNIRLFGDMTVLENVMVGLRGGLATDPASAHGGAARTLDRGLPALIFAALVALGWLSGDGIPIGQGELAPTLALATALAATAAWLWRIRRLGALSVRARAGEIADAARARALLDLVGLAARADAPARSLPYGEQRRLEIARALATEPRLLLLDEPAAGMNPSEIETLMTLVRAIRDRGVTVLVIEHHMRLVMGLCDYVVVLVQGKRIAAGTPAAVRADPRVIAAYLGEAPA